MRWRFDDSVPTIKLLKSTWLQLCRNEYWDFPLPNKQRAVRKVTRRHVQSYLGRYRGQGGKEMFKTWRQSVGGGARRSVTTKTLLRHKGLSQIAEPLPALGLV